MHPKANSSLNEYKVQSNVPVSEFAFFASEFTKATAEIEGINFSVFLHARHDKNMRLPKRVREDLEQELVETLQELGDTGCILHIKRSRLSKCQTACELLVGDGAWIPSMHCLERCC